MSRKKSKAPSVAAASGAGWKQPPKADLPWVAGPGSRGVRLRMGLILALAFLLRITALGWGIPGPTHGPFHPDELNGIRGIYKFWNDPRHLDATYFVTTKGAGYFYTGLATVAVASRLGLIPPRQDRIDSIDTVRRLFLLLRSLTVLFSLGTVALVFFTGRMLFGPRVAELAALLEAVSPISVINAHYIKTDCPEAFWVMVTLFLAVLSSRDRRWLIASMFTAGIAGAFKYPGVSAVIFPLAAALLLRPADRRGRLLTALLALPLAAVGFVMFYPGALFDFQDFYRGLTSEAGRKVLLDWKIPLARVLCYPFRLMQLNGEVLPLWAWAAMAYGLVRRRTESLLLLAWLLPYLLLMSSSAVALVRYAVPMMPVMALLMAAMVDSITVARPARARLARAAAAIAVGLILLVTILHLRTMLRPDPRNQAGTWVWSNVPAGETVAVTPTHDGDVFFTVQLDRSRHQQVDLYLRADQDASTYLDRNFNYLAANEQAWIKKRDTNPSQAVFWQTVNDPARWSLLVRFPNRFFWPGVLLRGTLPEDAYYLYEETRIYRRNSPR